MYKPILKVVLTFGLICFILVTMFNKGILRLNYPSKKKFPIRGIDISHHQKQIDWKIFKENNKDISFVFIKATEGGNFKDTMFLKNWNESKKAGLRRSAYHFFTLCKKGVLQAKNFSSVVPVLKNSMPHAVDLEFSGNCSNRPKKEEFLKELNDYISEIEKIYGKRPILYITDYFYKAYLSGEINDNLVWIRNIYSSPSFKKGEKWAFWQYANRGRLAGVETFIDLNVFNGSKSDFLKLMN